MSTAVSIVGGLGETVEIDTSHQSIMPEQRRGGSEGWSAAAGRWQGILAPVTQKSPRWTRETP